MLSDMESLGVSDISLGWAYGDSSLDDGDGLPYSGSIACKWVPGCALNESDRSRGYPESTSAWAKLSEQPDHYDPSVLVGSLARLLEVLRELMLLNLRGMISGIVGKSRGLISRANL